LRVEHEPDVGLSMPMAEGVGREHDLAFAGEEARLQSNGAPAATTCRGRPGWDAETRDLGVQRLEIADQGRIDDPGPSIARTRSASNGSFFLGEIDARRRENNSGRSMPVRTISGSRSPSMRTMSPATRGVAVAVSAIVGGSPMARAYSARRE